MRHQPREEFAALSPGSALRGKVAQLPSAGPVRTLLDMGGVGWKALAAIGGDRQRRPAGNAFAHAFVCGARIPAVERKAIPTLPLQRRGFSQRTSSKRAKSVSVE